ncbi:hypothetical protein AHF37_00774 [Paragonimus kellicotti]|nr:hypothetical protein AHF37_00774 [Paragonimus kellicotti]
MNQGIPQHTYSSHTIYQSYEGYTRQHLNSDQPRRPVDKTTHKHVGGNHKTPGDIKINSEMMVVAITEPKKEMYKVGTASKSVSTLEVS